MLRIYKYIGQHNENELRLPQTPQTHRQRQFVQQQLVNCVDCGEADGKFFLIQPSIVDRVIHVRVLRYRSKQRYLIRQRKTEKAYVPNKNFTFPLASSLLLITIVTVIRGD